MSTSLESPAKLSPHALPQGDLPDVEVSMVEEAEATGVTFTPELWMQRRHWALEALRREGVRSVLDIGCGPGSLLETLVMAPATIHEPPILPKPPATTSQLPSPANSEAGDAETRELFITRLAGLDISPNVIASALSIIDPSASSSFTPPRPRWEPLEAQLWLGGIEKYNSHLEGYEAIVGLELIEHLDPNVLSRFGVVTMGTYRPRLLLVTTPNFDFNAKFPRNEVSAQKGFVDPTGRTERVFRHSDHKVEMTSAEFREWAEAAASDWGYDVEISGVGISSKPSYYPTEGDLPARPIFATQTAIFRLSSIPTRSPRSVRSSELPFMSNELLHPHKLAGKFIRPATRPRTGRLPPEAVRHRVRTCMEGWQVGEITLVELWGRDEVAVACGGSRRYLVGSLGGWGDCPALDAQTDFDVVKRRGNDFDVRWKGFVAAPKEEASDMRMEVDPPRDGTGSW